MPKPNKGAAICETVRELKFKEHLRKLAEQREKQKKRSGK